MSKIACVGVAIVWAVALCVVPADSVPLGGIPPAPAPKDLPDEPAPVIDRPAKKLTPPDIVSSLMGVHVKVPPKSQVYLDKSLYDLESIRISLQNRQSGLVSGACETEVVGGDFVEYEANECAGPLFSPLSTDYSVLVDGLTVDGDEFSWEQEFTWLRPAANPWPLENVEGVWPPSEPNLCGNLAENYQSFGLTPYWHQGCDVRGWLVDGGVAQPVHSPVAGLVVNVVKYSGNDLYWSVMVRDNLGFVWQHHHIDVDTISVEIGEEIPQGHVLGYIAFWPSQWNGEFYHHEHLNIVRPHPDWDTSLPLPPPYIDGWQYFQTFDFFDNGNYTNEGDDPFSPGVFYFFENESNQAFASSEESEVVVSGDIDIVIELGSLFEPTNDIGGHPYENALHTVEYAIFAADSGELVKRATLIDMDRLPGSWPYNFPEFEVVESEIMLLWVFRQSFTYQNTVHRSIFDYNNRVFYYTLTNTFRGQPDAEHGFWATSEVPNGAYRIEMTASDFWGKTVQASTVVVVDN